MTLLSAPNRLRLRTPLALVVLLAAFAAPVRAQEAPAPPAAPQPQTPLLKVFVDCNRCDDDYLRQNVGFIDYVRDRAVADVHVLVTTQETGGGGLAWTVRF